MMRKFVAVLTILAVVISNIGCSNLARVSVQQEKEKARSKPTLNIVALRLASGITGVILKDWEIVSFDSFGGTFDPETETISGVDLQGTPVEFKLDEIRDVQIPPDSHIKFDENKAYLDTKLLQIRGTTEDGESVAIPTKEVLDLSIKREIIPLWPLLAIAAVGLIVWIAIDLSKPVDIQIPDIH